MFVHHVWHEFRRKVAAEQDNKMAFRLKRSSLDRIFEDQQPKGHRIFLLFPMSDQCFPLPCSETSTLLSMNPDTISGYETGGCPGNERCKGKLRSKFSRAIADVPKAQSDRAPPAKSNVLGSIESAAGSAAGCEGMVEEGKERKM